MGSDEDWPANLGLRSHPWELLAQMRPGQIHRPGEGTWLRGADGEGPPEERLVSLSSGGRHGRGLVGDKFSPVAQPSMQHDRELAGQGDFALRGPARLATPSAQVFRSEPLIGRLRMMLAAS